MTFDRYFSELKPKFSIKQYNIMSSATQHAIQNTAEGGEGSVLAVGPQVPSTCLAICGIPTYLLLK